MRKLKLIHTADFHLDSPFSNLPFEEREKRRQAQRENLFKLADAAIENKVDAILICGDVFDSENVSHETFSAFYKAFSYLSMPVFIVAGNHDYYSINSPWEKFKLPENVVMFKSNEFKSYICEDINARFFGASFVESASSSLLKGFTPPEKYSDLWDIMLLHGEVNSGLGFYNPISRSQIEGTKMDYLALGHIHKRSELMFAGKTAYSYCGAIAGRGYDEIGPMGAYIVELSDKGVTTDFLPLASTRYWDFAVEMGGVEPFDAIERAIIGLGKSDYVRIKLKGETVEDINIHDITKAFQWKFAEFIIKDETILKLNPWLYENTSGIKGEYLSMLRKLYEKASSEQERRVIEMAASFGIKALENGGQRL